MELLAGSKRKIDYKVVLTWKRGGTFDTDAPTLDVAQMHADRLGRYDDAEKVEIFRRVTIETLEKVA